MTKFGMSELRNHGSDCYKIDAGNYVGDITPHAKNQSDRPRGASRQICETSLSRGFWATACKTVRPMLSDSPVCPVCLSVCLTVCNVGVLWPNGGMDKNVTF